MRVVELREVRFVWMYTPLGSPCALPAPPITLSPLGQRAWAVAIPFGGTVIDARTIS